MVDATRRHCVFVIGTRAQLIKVAPVVVACEKAGLPVTLLMTGQHQETMQDLIEEFGIRSAPVPAMRIAERATVGSLLRWLPAAYAGVSRHLRRMSSQSKLNVLVHGDTLSTLIGAIAGRRHGACVVHLESGLSSGRLFDPFPEEILRRLVFCFTDIAMCPNPVAVRRMRERRRPAVVDTGGNTIIDAVSMSGAASVIADHTKPYFVVSLHRFQNLYDARRLKALVELIEQCGQLAPVHFILHPATRKRLVAEGLDERLRVAAQVNLSPRLGYGAFLRLAAGAACVLTDGGSNQEELAALGVPTIIMRERTERPDGLGVNALMEAEVPGGVATFLETRSYISLRREPSPQGGGSPSHRIVAVLAESLETVDESQETRR